MPVLRRLLFSVLGRGACVLILMWAALSLGAAPSEEPLEFAIKGAYLSKFGEYVDWPSKAFPSAGTPFVIGILGQDPFGPKLEQVVQGRTIQGRPIVIRRFKRADQVQQVHVLYISVEEWGRSEELRAELRGQNILTVSEKDPRSEAVVSFVLQQGKVRFEINMGAAERAELKLSSKLLGLATSVKRAGSSG